MPLLLPRFGKRNPLGDAARTDSERDDERECMIMDRPLLPPPLLLMLMALEVPSATEDEDEEDEDWPASPDAPKPETDEDTIRGDDEEAEGSAGMDSNPADAAAEDEDGGAKLDAAPPPPNTRSKYEPAAGDEAAEDT